MQTESNRAFKEWAVACAAMQSGEQILLVRKGGIREEGGQFTIADTEFLLLPTYEHQNAALLQPMWAERLQAQFGPSTVAAETDPNRILLSAYAVVDTILQARDDAQVNAVADCHIWNPTYVKQRFDFNPYDPLYLLVLRVYNLPQPASLPLLPAYIGCKSWITLERAIDLHGAVPALSDQEFARRRTDLLTRLQQN